MTETAMMTTDLDRLLGRVEKAALLIQKLRDDHEKAVRERDELQQKYQDLERKLQGQDASALVTELATLRREQKDWHTERRDIADRIETMLLKLERVEA